MIGDNLKFLRKQYNISQRDLATALNISKSAVGSYEVGSREPDFETLIKIANYFDVTTDMLLNRQELEMHIKADYIKIIKKAESLDITADELDQILEATLKLRGKK